MRPRLVLKSMHLSSEKTERLYALARETVDSFNLYVADFHESVVILEEQHAAAVRKGDIPAAKETEEKILYIKGRIEQLHASMKKISEDLHSLVELQLPA